MKCEICNKRAYSNFCVQHKPRKPIAQNVKPKPHGKQYELWQDFRLRTAIPYLDRTHGHSCVCCGTSQGLDIDHIVNKGSRPDLKYAVENLQYLCRSCHINKTARLECNH
jgi:5-methylcytosine-specific restriction endonuclease McrA